MNCLPGKLKFRRGRGGRILREAFADLLPRPAARRVFSPEEWEACTLRDIRGNCGLLVKS